MPHRQGHHDHVEMPWTEHYPKGISHHLGPLPWNNLREMCIGAATKYGHKKAFTLCLPNGMTTSLSFDQIDKLSDAFAAYLRVEMGMQPGERVAVMLPNSPNYPVAAFGVLKAGLVLVNVNPLYTADELGFILADSGAAALVTMNLFLDRIETLSRRMKMPSVIVAKMGDYFSALPKMAIKASLRLKRQVNATTLPTIRMREAIAIGRKHFDEIRPWSRRSWEGSKHLATKTSTEIGPDDLAVLQYTGGTTGVSKGAMLSHANLMANVQQIRQFSRHAIAEGEETMLTVLPLYHIFAFCVNMMVFYVEGAHNILIPNPRPISNMKAAFDKFSINWITGVNTLYHALLEEPWFRDNPPRLKACIGGGTAVQRVVAERWEKVVGKPLLEGYGLSETSPACTLNPLTGGHKIGSIGLPVPGTKVCILDENHRPVAQGEDGELAVIGPQVMSGYWNRPDETELVFHKNWFLTGDIGRMDEKGMFYIVDRKKDMILVSGFNVYPNEVEDALMEHPDVKECAVIGIPADVRGEDVVAYVIPRTQALHHDALRQHCKERLAAYKIPRQTVFVKELPKTNVGKVLRKELRRLHAQKQ